MTVRRLVRSSRQSREAVRVSEAMEPVVRTVMSHGVTAQSVPTPDAVEPCRWRIPCKTESQQAN